MIQSGMHGRIINECRSNDCRSYECRRNNCRSNDCRSNETTPFNHLLENKLLYKFQSGFIPGHSTSHQLIELYHTILLALEAKQVTSVTFADISKAFDKVELFRTIYLIKGSRII